MGIAAPAVFTTPEAVAQSRWIFSVAVPSEIEWDSNSAMSSTATVPVTRVRASPRLIASYKAGQDELALDIAGVMERSSDSSVSSNRFDPRLRADWRRATAGTDFGAFGILEQRAYRSLEVDQTTPVGVDGTRTLAAFGGSISHRFSENAALSADVRQEWVRFDGGPAADYQMWSANTQFSHFLDERSNWYALASHQVYRTDGTTLGAGESGSSGLMLGYRRSASESLNWDVAAGAVTISGPARGTGLQSSIKVNYVAERLQATLEAARRPSALASRSGIGLSDTLRLQIRYILDARSTLVFDASASRSNAVDRGASYALAYSRELTPFWTITARALHRERRTSGGSAAGNVIGLVLAYSHPDF